MIFHFDHHFGSYGHMRLVKHWTYLNGWSDFGSYVNMTQVKLGRILRVGLLTKQ